jgi:hypothetical protein
MAGEEKQDAVATALALEGVALGVEGMQIGGDERASSETTPTTPSRTTSGSGSGSGGGSGKRTNLTKEERAEQGKNPTPTDLKKDIKTLNEKLAQVNE